MWILQYVWRVTVTRSERGFRVELQESRARRARRGERELELLSERNVRPSRLWRWSDKMTEEWSLNDQSENRNPKT